MYAAAMHDALRKTHGTKYIESGQIITATPIPILCTHTHTQKKGETVERATSKDELLLITYGLKGHRRRCWIGGAS
jgi:hypothetical protein